MDITIHSSFLPHDDPEESLTFYRDILGFEVRLDVGKNKMRWITVGPPNQPDTAIVLYPPTATPGITDDERRVIAEMMAKGTFGTLLLATRISTERSSGCRPATSTWFRSRPSSRTGYATAPSAIPRGTWSAFKR